MKKKNQLTHTSSSGLSADMSSKQKGTLKKLLSELIFEMFQIVENCIEEN